jgi:uncharacterized protein (TIGR02271 family)
MQGVQEGMTVRTADGEKLGKIVTCESDRFIIEKGFFFPKDYLARYDDVAEIREDEVHLRLSADQLRKLGDESAAEPAGEAGMSAGREMPPPATTPGEVPAARAAGVSENLSVPVAEEELTAEKRSREAGAVRVRKDVVTERRDVSVPVTREEVHVERVPAGQEATPGEASFQEGSVSVPIREEEVEIRKRPVVRERVNVSKTSRQEERRAEADVRKEKVDIEKEGDVDVARRDEPKE